MYIDERVNEQKGVERMEDEKIVELFWNCAEKAVEEAEENTTGSAAASPIICWTLNWMRRSASTMRCWRPGSIPHHRPAALAAYLGRLTRNLSIDRIKARSRIKRGGGEYALLLSELEKCIPDRSTTDGKAKRAP